MDPVVGIIAIVAVSIFVLAVAFAIGMRVGANLTGRALVQSIIDQGFVNVGGVRYRVDQIGRKAK